MRISKVNRTHVNRASQRAYESYVREDAERQARNRHNGVDARELCDRCGKPIEPRDMMVGDFETFHRGCSR